MVPDDSGEASCADIVWRRGRCEEDVADAPANERAAECDEVYSFDTSAASVLAAISMRARLKVNLFGDLERRTYSTGECSIATVDLVKSRMRCIKSNFISSPTANLRNEADNSGKQENQLCF